MKVGRRESVSGGRRRRIEVGQSEVRRDEVDVSRTEGGREDERDGEEKAGQLRDETEKGKTEGGLSLSAVDHPSL